MKRLNIIILALLSCIATFAQTAPKTNLALQVVVENMVEPFPPAAKAQMVNKLTTLLTQNGIASSDYQNQFVITAFVVPQTKDILPGAPTQIAETMDVTFYIADIYNQLVFSTATISAKGVGNTEAKSYMDALRHINLNSPKLTAFVQEGKDKIINYYNTQAPAIFERAMTLAKMKDYTQALYLLSAIPAECEHFTQANEYGLQVYQLFIDNDCQKYLAAARAAWSAQQNADGANAAGEYLQLIYPDASCYAEAMALYQEIKSKVLDDWKFEMKKYQDGVDLESQRISAWRGVGTAYGQHQQPQTTNIGFLR